MMSKQVLMYSEWCRYLGYDNAALGIWFPTFKTLQKKCYIIQTDSQGTPFIQ